MSKSIALVRKYELFSHDKGESLSDYYNPFNSLLNDLKPLCRVYDNEEILCKFMDCLPDFWKNICTCIKTTKDFDHKQTKLQRMNVIIDIKGSSIALLSDSDHVKHPKNRANLNLK